MADDGTPQLLDQPVTPPEEIERIFLDAVVREDVFPSGQFSMALPRLWLVDTPGEATYPDPERPVLTIARAVPGTAEAHGAEIGAKVNVHSAFLPRVINGSDWLQRWSVTQGLDLQQLRELPTAFGLLGDGLALAPQSGRLHRMLTIKDGDLLFLVDGSVDHGGDPSRPQLQEIALMAMMRFRLLAPSGQHYAEQMQEISLDGTAGGVRFLLPDSWMPVASDEPPPPNGALGQWILPGPERVAGTLVAALGSAPGTAEPLESVLLGKLEAQGMQFAEATETLSVTREATMMQVMQRRGTARGADAVLLLVRANHAGVPLSLALLTPSAAEDFETWAINRRVFEITLETLRMSAA